MRGYQRQSPWAANWLLSLAAFDPEPPVEFLQSCPTLTPGFFVFRIYEAAVRDLRHPARTGHSHANLDTQIQQVIRDRVLATTANHMPQAIR